MMKIKANGHLKTFINRIQGSSGLSRMYSEPSTYLNCWAMQWEAKPKEQEEPWET